MAIFKKKEIKKEKQKSKNIETSKKVDSTAWQVLEEPYLSEKATELAKENKYIFKVSSIANKITVKQAIEELYGINVVAVNIVNIPRKKKKLGRHKGWRKGFKKAIIEVKKGQRIDTSSK